MLQKPADNDYPILDLLKQRWSTRAFDSRLVEHEKLLSLFEAARWSASCFNEQPWRFIVATRDQSESFAKVLSCLNNSNQTWAQHVPVLMLTVTHLQFEVDGSPNHHAVHDIGLTIQNLIVQATSMGLMVRQMAGIHPERAHEIYGIPHESYRVVTAVAIGYQGTADHLSEKNQARELEPRRRKPLTELVFGEWNEPSPLIVR
ncbi:MAG TPA: nitroreductase family protein [Phototrophicaceae bacterium]|nr:nitroreductase family protein [Phototrophicaceae bacterium]